MAYETPFASVTADRGPASELVHVSPIFARCGPSRRGEFSDRRLARARRTTARQAARYPAATIGSEDAMSAVEVRTDERGRTPAPTNRLA